MTNPTLNRAYDMPASTDLVTNLPADFAIFGDAVDLDISSRGGYTSVATAAGTTTLTVTSNRNIRFTGVTTQNCDLPVASTLAVGARWVIQNKSTGIVTVRSSGGNTIYAIPAGATAEFVCILASGTGTASWDYDWAGASGAPGSSALVLVKRASFSAVANTGTTFDTVFNSTYNSYIINIETLNCSGTGDIRFNWRVAGATQSAASYNGNSHGYQHNGALVNSPFSAITYATLSALGAGTFLSAWLKCDRVGQSLSTPFIGGDVNQNYNHLILTFGADYNATANHDGFILTPSTGTITGTISVYGLAVA